jgi:hypothetical protein
MSSFLSAAQRAAIRATKAGDHNSSVDIYRAPTVSGGKRGVLALLTSDVVCRIWPAAQATKIMQSLPELTMVRYDMVAFFAETDDVQRGDEVRDGTTRYEVTGLGNWRDTNVAALARVETV